MPIRPEEKHRYPNNWHDISRQRKEKAGWTCEFCGVEQYAVGWRDDQGNFHYDPAWLENFGNGAYCDHATARQAADIRNESGKTPKWIVIVLTVAHLDHTPENNEPENLRALCQKCHLDHDRKHHTQSRIRNARDQHTIDMFGDQSHG